MAEKAQPSGQVPSGHREEHIELPAPVKTGEARQVCKIWHARVLLAGIVRDGVFVRLFIVVVGAP